MNEVLIMLMFVAGITLAGLALNWFVETAWDEFTSWNIKRLDKKFNEKDRN